MFDDGDYNNGEDAVDNSDQSVADDVNGGDEEDDDSGDNDNVAELLHHR